MGVDEGLIFINPSCLFQEGDGFSGVVTHVIGGRLPCGAEHFRRQLGFELFQLGKFRAFGFSGGRELGIGEDAGDALLRAEEQVFIEPVKIEHHAQRLTHAGILEFGAAGVEDHGAQPLGAVMRDFFLDHPALAERAAIIRGEPFMHVILMPQVIVARLESLQGNVVIAVISEGDGVKIIHADIDRQIFRPPVLHALVNDFAARHDGFNLVGSAAERRVERGFGHIVLEPVMFRQHGHHREDHHGFAVIAFAEGEFDIMRRDDFNIRHQPIHASPYRMAMRAVDLIAPFHIFHRHRHAIVEAGLRVEVKDDP